MVKQSQKLIKNYFGISFRNSNNKSVDTGAANPADEKTKRRRFIPVILILVLLLIVTGIVAVLVYVFVLKEEGGFIEVSLVFFNVVCHTGTAVRDRKLQK